MKQILLLGVLLCINHCIYSQTFNISTPSIASGAHGDPLTGYTATEVTGTTLRNSGVTYSHNTPAFWVSSGWITPFSDPIFIGTPSNNADYFLAPGNNTISNTAGDAVIIFDTVYFNNGSSSRMDITSYGGSPLTSSNTNAVVPGSIVVSRKLFFNNGITSTNRTYPVKGAIVFANNASYDGGNTDAQHVDGFISEANFAAHPGSPGHGGMFTFPVGNGTTLLSLTRTGNFTSLDNTLTVSWIEGDPNSTPDPTVSTSTSQIHPTTPTFVDIVSGITTITNIGFWDWHYQEIDDPTFSPGAMPDAQTITVSLPNMSVLPIAASDLRLAAWDAAAGIWFNLSGTTGASGLTKGSTLTGVIPAGRQVAAIAIASTNAALPVTFSSFKVTAQGCKAMIYWQTSFELNNNYFKVERSANAREFTTIAQVSSLGNSTNTQNYQFVDQAPLEGVNYYRITQVDFDGKNANAGVQSIRIQCNGVVNLKVFPNPARSQVNVLTGKAVSQVNILNASGQAVIKHAPSLNQGGTFSLNVSTISSGVYFLQVINKDGTRDLIKFFKE